MDPVLENGIKTGEIDQVCKIMSNILTIIQKMTNRSF